MGRTGPAKSILLNAYSRISGVGQRQPTKILLEVARIFSRAEGRTERSQDYFISVVIFDLCEISKDIYFAD